MSNEFQILKGMVKAAKAVSAKTTPAFKTAALLATASCLPMSLVSCETPAYVSAPAPSYQVGYVPSVVPNGYINATSTQAYGDGSSVTMQYGANVDLQVARAYHQMNLQSQREARRQNNDNVRNLNQISREVRQWYRVLQRD